MTPTSFPLPPPGRILIPLIKGGQDYSPEGSSGRCYEMTVYKKDETGIKRRVEVIPAPNEETLKEISSLVCNIITTFRISADEHFTVKPNGIYSQGRRISREHRLLCKLLDTLFLSQFSKDQRKSRVYPPSPETSTNPFPTSTQLLAPRASQAIVDGESINDIDEENAEIAFSAEGIESPPLLAPEFSSNPLLDHRTGAIDFSISQFKQSNEDWCIKNKNWYEALPLSLKLRILRDIQGEYTPRTEMSGPLCEAIRTHLIKASPSEQPRLIAEEIARLEKLQQTSRLSPLLAQAEKIYSTFKTAFPKSLLKKTDCYTETLLQIYTLTEKTRDKFPAAFASLQKIARAEGIILNDAVIHPPSGPVTPLTQGLIHTFVEVLALWIDNEGRAPWEEKPKTPFWRPLTRALWGHE